MRKKEFRKEKRKKKKGTHGKRNRGNYLNEEKKKLKMDLAERVSRSRKRWRDLKAA